MTGAKHININTINIAACSTAPWQLRGTLVMQHPDNATIAVKGRSMYRNVKICRVGAVVIER